MILFDVQLEEWVQKSSKNHEYIQKEKGIPASAYFLLGSFASDGDIHVGHASKCPVHLSALQEMRQIRMSAMQSVTIPCKNASSAAKKGTNSKEALQGGGDGANPTFN
uniref:Uncharacterized protein n=1 Tax=Caenorhabditis japonica TaxID=281687 RepID=A0A8R1DKV5_CAEJA